MPSTYEIPSRITRPTAELLYEAVLALLQRNGSIRDGSGRATATLAEDLAVERTTVTRIMRVAEAAGLATRDVRGKLTFGYRLTADGAALPDDPDVILELVNRRLAQGPSPVPAATPTPTVAAAPPAAPAAPRVDVDALAASLLEQVIHRAHTNGNATAPVVNQHQLAEKDRTIATLRRELTEAQQETQRTKAALATVNAELVAARELAARSKNRNGARIVDRISPESRNDLVKLMKMAPTG